MSNDRMKFTVRWSLNKYTSRMKKIGEQITTILELAQADFLAVNDIFRRCNVDAKLHPAIASRISDAIKFLQYMDTLTQKLNHIVQINQALMDADRTLLLLPDETLDDDPVEFIFRLNYFQAMVAHKEFLSTVNTLKQLIDESNNEYNLPKLIVPSGRKAFGNLEIGESNMNFLFLMLHAIYTERHDEQRNAVCPAADVSRIAVLYTMNSERLVLDWLQTHRDDNEAELMRIYSCNGFGQVEEQTEIF